MIGIPDRVGTWFASHRHDRESLALLGGGARVNAVPESMPRVSFAGPTAGTSLETPVI